MSLRLTRPAIRRARIGAMALALATVVGAGFAADGRTHTGRTDLDAATPHAITLRLGATTQMTRRPAHQPSGVFVSSAPPAPSPMFPLRVSEDGRYLVDKRGKPWRVQADAAWLMSSEATAPEVDTYLAKRRAQGFDSFDLMAMVHPGGYSAATHAPNDRRGDPPFATPGDFSSAGMSAASRRYWSWIDTIVAKAAAQHMVVMLAYTYLGYMGGDQGWYRTVLDQSSRAALYNWGAWLEIVSEPLRTSFGSGWAITRRPTGPRAHCERARSPTASSRPALRSCSWPRPRRRTRFPARCRTSARSSIRTASTVTAPGAWVGCTSPPIGRGRFPLQRPAWMQEGTYEYENNQGHFSAEPWDTRRGRFCRSCRRYRRRRLRIQGRLAMAEHSTLPLSRQARDTRPSRSSCSGRCRGGSCVLREWRRAKRARIWGRPDGERGAAQAITSAVTSDRRWLLAYVPVTEKGPRTFSVATSALKGQVRASWFDPTTGNSIAIGDGYRNAATGTRSFTTPGKRGDGTDDWLLVLDSTRVSPCGTITTGGAYTAPTKRLRGVMCEVIVSPKSDPSAGVGLEIRFENP